MQKARVKTSDMALHILETIAFSEDPMSQTQIAEAMGIVKSAAHKHLFTLEESGWVARDPISGRYGLGPKAWLVGQRATHIADLAASADSLMRNTRSETGLAVTMSTVNKRMLNVIAALHGTHAIEIGVRQGSQLSLHSSAQGQVMLAWSEPTLLEDICAGEMKALTPHTITDAAALRARIEQTRARGYGLAPEETLLGVNVIAAPVFDHAGRLIATVAMVGSIQYLTTPPSEDHIRAITTLGQAISQTRGYRGPMPGA
ncbi:IclR family transcriptional regulator [Pseudooceanicola sp. 502str34]